MAAVREEIEDSGDEALPVTTEAKDPDSVAASFDRVRNDLGDPEIFVYNAGAFQIGGVLEISPAKFDECFRVNCANSR